MGIHSAAWFVERKRKFFDRWQGPLRAIAIAMCRLYRRTALRRVVFIGITGSCGKTTTKNLVTAALSVRGRVRSNPGNRNHFGAVVRLVLGTRPWHRFCVAEIAAMRVGDVALLTRVFRPEIAVVTALGTDHYRSFRGPQGASREKSALLEALPATGTVILNRDDEVVWGMRASTRARVVGFGRHLEAHVRLEDAQGGWPEGYVVTAETPQGRVSIPLKLWGRHQAHNVLAALAVADAVGIPAEQAAARLAAVEPETGRLSVMQAGSGITYVRDDVKASPMSLGPLLDFAREARAPRKVLVVGTLSDYPGDSSRAYRRFAESALAIAADVIFVGGNAARVARVVSADGRSPLVLATVRELAEHLDAHARPGDLVMLKASVADHVERVALRHQRDVLCWRERCGIRRSCDECPYLTRPDARLPGRGR